MASLSSETDICNRALTKLGANRITTLSDNTESARTLSAMFDFVRDSELRAHIWRFSIFSTTLPQNDYVPPFVYKKAFNVPSDCLRIVQINSLYTPVGLNLYIGLQEQAPYSIETVGDQEMIFIGNSFAGFTNPTNPLRIRYVQRITNVGQFDPCFVEALACKLAMEACERLTQSANKRKMAQQEYQEALRIAAIANAIETPPVPIPDDSWMLGRV